MRTIDFNSISLHDTQNWLQYAVAPRPIALASTIDKHGNVNLSPFSFFNLVSYAPPLVVFSVVLRSRDNSRKHTLENILEVPEVVINICDYPMVNQVSITGYEFPKDQDEFLKAGFTKQPASRVTPPMVRESKAKLECKVVEVKSFASEGSAGQLVIAEVVCMHVNESIMNEEGTMIDQEKLELVARLGGNWYCRVSKPNLFEVPKPQRGGLVIGFDALPASILNSDVLTGNNLAQLASIKEVPFIDPAFEDEKLTHIMQYFSNSPAELEAELHHYAKELLEQNKTTQAWQVLLTAAQ